MNVSSAITVNVPPDMPIARRREEEVQRQSTPQVPASLLENRKDAKPQKPARPGSLSIYA